MSKFNADGKFRTQEREEREFESKVNSLTQTVQSKVATTGHCTKHNTFFTIPGGNCQQCGADLLALLKGSGELFSSEPTPGVTKIIVHPKVEEPSGAEEFWETGSKRYNTGKVQLREVDPAFILGIGEVLTASRAKYEEGNWMGETKLSTPYESCMRHMMKFWAGEQLDEGPDGTGLSHLLHAATNLMFLYYHLSSGKGIDDRLFKKKKDE